jgi:hypothetical protein
MWVWNVGCKIIGGIQGQWADWVEASSGASERPRLSCPGADTRKVRSKKP